MNRLLCACIGGALAVAAAPAFGSQLLLDNFNRPDSTYMGPAWTENAVDFRVEANQATSSDFALMTQPLPVGYTASNWISVDAIHNTSRETQYAGLVLRYADVFDNVIVKLQDNGGTGAFNRLYFRYGNGSSAQGWNGMTGGSDWVVIPPTARAQLRAKVEGDTLTVQLDEGLDGLYNMTFTRGGLPTARLGTGVGVAGFGEPRIDNFTIDNLGLMPVPEPSALLLAAPLAALIRRRK